jgi:hypothetical protein
MIKMIKKNVINDVIVLKDFRNALLVFVDGIDEFLFCFFYMFSFSFGSSSRSIQACFKYF